MTTAANALHEFYISFIAAGFTEEQSLKLTAELLKISHDNIMDFSFLRSDWVSEHLEREVAIT